jgi:F-type H+-transporting ATPase subunit b
MKTSAIECVMNLKKTIVWSLTSVAVMCPGLVWAAGGGDHGDAHFPWAEFGASWVNFVIFLLILWKFALPPIQKFFAERREALLANLNEAKRLREEAAAKLSEYESKLDALDVEREALLAEYKVQGERERDRIVEDAKRQVEKLRGDAELIIAQEVKKATAMLEAQAVEQAVDIARERVQKKLAVSGQDKLVTRYVEDLKKLGDQKTAA